MKDTKKALFTDDLDDHQLFWINVNDYLKFFGTTVVNYYVKGGKYSQASIEDFHLSSMFEYGAISFHVNEDQQPDEFNVISLN